MCAKQSEGKEHILRERQNALVNINDADTNEDIQHFNDEEQDRYDKEIAANRAIELENEKNKDNKDYVKKDVKAVKPVSPAKQMTEFERALAKLNMATEKSAKQADNLLRNSPSGGNTANTDTANTTNANANVDKTTTAANPTNAGQQQTAATAPRLNVSALSEASKDVKKDPEALLKEKAVKLGVEFGRPIGNKVAVEGAATSNQQKDRLQLIPADGSVPQLGTAKPTVTEAAAAKEGEKAPEPQVTMSDEQAAEHYSNQFRMGFSNGYNMGYMEGQRVKNAAKAQEKQKGLEELKKTAAYKDGETTGTNLSTATGDAKTAAQATADTMRAKYLTPVEKAPMKTTVVDGVSQQTPDVTEQQKKDAEAYKLGFNAAYTKGQATARKAGEDKIKADRELPEYKAGADLAKQAVADPATKTAKQAEAEKSELSKRGFVETFNLEYQKAMGEAQKARMTAASAVDETNAAVIAGKKAAEAQIAAEAADKIARTKQAFAPPPQNAPAPPDNNTEVAENISDKAFADHLAAIGLNPDKEEDKDKISAERTLYVAGFNKAYISGRVAASENVRKMSPTNSLKYRQGQEVGKIIGMLTAEGGDTALAKKEGIGELIGTEKITDADGNTTHAPATMTALKKYLSDQKYYVLPKEAPKPLTAEDRKGMDAAEIKRRSDEYDAYLVATTNQGTENDFNSGYDVGYNSGYMVGKAKESRGAAKTTSVASLDFKAGEEEGKGIGIMAAEVKQKNGSPEAEAKFNLELSNIRAQAQAQGAQFYQGFLSGYNIGYVGKMGGVEPEEKIIIADENLLKTIKAYEAKGDTNMVELLQAKYEAGYSDNYKSVYEKLTEHFKPKDGGGEKSQEKFATIPSDADLEQARLTAVAAQEGENGECAKAFVEEKKLIEKIKAATVNPNKIKEIDGKATIITEEIKALASAFAAGYAAALQKAKDDGYSFIKGFQDKIKAIDDGINGVEKPTLTPENAKALKDAEEAKLTFKVISKQVAKGEEAAEGFASAMRMNAQMKAKGLKPIEGLAMPPVVVTTAYKQGYEESSQKWRIAKLIQSGIPIPAKLRDGEMYKAYHTEKETTLPDTGEEINAAPTTDEATKEKVNPPKESEKAVPLTRATYGADGARFKVPEKADDAAELLKQSETITETDLNFFQAELIAGYFEKVLAFKNAKKSQAKGEDEKAFEDAQSKFDAATEADISSVQKTYFELLPKRLATLKAASSTITDEQLTTANTAVETAKKALSGTVTKEALGTIRTALATGIKPVLSPANDEVTAMKSKNLEGRETAFAALCTEVFGEDKDGKAAEFSKSIRKSAKDFKQGYKKARDEAKADQTSTDEDDENNFANYLEDYAEEIGYAHGFLQKVAKLGIENNQKEKALRLIQKFINDTKTNIPAETAENIAALKTYDNADQVAIDCTVECKKYLKGADTKIQQIYDTAHATFASKGEVDAIAAFNLSTKTFSFTGGTQFSDENSNFVRPMGPLGTLADKYFQKVMEIASGLRVLPEIAATVPTLAADIKKAANVEALDKSKEKPYGKFKIALFGADAEVNSTMQAKTLKFEPTKPLAYKSQDQFGEINLSTKSQIALDATKQNLQFGSEDKTPKGSDKITLVSDAKKQFSIVGGGLRLSLGKEPMTMFAPKVIIPSLQKQLNAKDAKGNAVSANEAFVIENLKIGEGAIKLKADDLKSALTQLRNNLITALNKKEDTTKTDSSIPNVSPK